MWCDRSPAQVATAVTDCCGRDPQVDDVLHGDGPSRTVGVERFGFDRCLDGHDRVAPRFRSDHPIEVLEGRQR